MSCEQIALSELGIIPEKYYASEIDKYAIAQTQLNFPTTIQLGDVTKWQEWSIEWNKIDLITAGSPCQGFSFAGKGLAFDDSRSKLFFVFVDILSHIRKYNPNVKFLLENVNMKKEYLTKINQILGILPVFINSSLVSAQNRKRWYWTNIRTKQNGLFGGLETDIPQPQDEGILLKDILEQKVDEKYYISETAISRMHRKKYSGPLINPDKTGTLNTKNNSGQLCFDSGTTLISNEGNIPDTEIYCVAVRGRNPDNSSDRNPGIPLQQTIEPNLSGKTNCLTSVQKDNLVFCKNYVQWDTSGKGSRSQNERAFYENSKHGSLTTQGIGHTGVLKKYTLRRLTPLECARLQTIPEWYKWQCSDSQQYKMLGNGWTVKVIMHILSYF